MNRLTRDHVVAQARLHFILHAVSALRFPIDACYVGNAREGRFEHDNGSGVTVAVFWDGEMACGVVWDSDYAPTDERAPQAFSSAIKSRAEALGQLPTAVLSTNEDGTHLTGLRRALKPASAHGAGANTDVLTPPLSGSFRRLSGYFSSPDEALESAPGKQGWLELADLSAEQGRTIKTIWERSSGAPYRLTREDETGLLAFPEPAELEAENVTAAAQALVSAGILWERATSSVE